MTDHHPITPPPELVEQWLTEWSSGVLPGTAPQYIATQAARWGADQELEACIEVILSYPGFESPELFVEVLRDARRPKPPGLKEQALQALNRFMAAEGHEDCTDEDIEDDYYLIRKAVESLSD